MIQVLQVAAVLVVVVSAPFGVIALALLERWRVERGDAPLA
jgi:hypothetical protein